MRLNVALAIILTAMLISGCRTTPLTLTTEQCSPYIAVVENGEIDLEHSKCFCRQYTFDRYFVGPESGTQIDHPLEYCNKIVGFTNYSDVATFWEKVRRAISNQ